jgi:hypothetical protein
VEDGGAAAAMHEVRARGYDSKGYDSHKSRLTGCNLFLPCSSCPVLAYRVLQVGFYKGYYKGYYKGFIRVLQGFYKGF